MEDLIKLLDKQDDEIYKSFARVLKYAQKQEKEEDDKDGE